MTIPTTHGYADEVLSSAVQQVAQQSRVLGHHITGHEEWIAGVQQRVDQAILAARGTLQQSYQTALSEMDAQTEARKAELLAEFAGATAAVRQEAATNLAHLQETHSQQITKIAADGTALLESVRSEITVALQQMAAERERMQAQHREEGENQRRTLNRQHHETLENSLEVTRQERETQRDEYQRLRQQTAADLDLERERMQTAHREAAESQRQVLNREHNESLANSLEATRQERDAQSNEYQLIRQQTVTDFQTSLSASTAQLNREHQNSNDRAVADFQTSLSEATAQLNREHQSSNEQAVAAVSADRTKFTRILIAVAGVSSAIAIANLVVTLL